VHDGRDTLKFEIIGDPNPIELERKIVAIADLFVSNEADVDAQRIMHVDLSRTRPMFGWQDSGVLHALPQERSPRSGTLPVAC